MLGFDPPRRALAIFRALDRLGQLGGAIAIGALRHGDRPGLIDELGTLTFAELDARSNALASASFAGMSGPPTAGIFGALPVSTPSSVSTPRIRCALAP